MTVPQLNIDVSINEVEAAIKSLINKHEIISSLLESAELRSITVVFDRDHEPLQSVYKAPMREN